MLTALIDGDIYAYKSASSVEVETHWGDGLWTLHADENEAIRMFDDMMSSIQETLEADKVLVCLSDFKNFRHDVFPEYKANRVNTRKPVCYMALREHIMENYDTYLRPKLEADDILGILMTNPKIVEGDKIMVSEDKDLLCIPGKLYNTNKPDEGVLEISEQDANYYHLYQTLIGDTADGFKGCPGIGPVKAEKILMGVAPPWGTLDEVWQAILEAYEKAGLSEEVALQQARVARILRTEDYDFKNKEPILWTP